MMKTLVIGADGQVGHEFQKLLGTQHFSGLSHEAIDVSDEQSVNQALHEVEADTIINLAAFHDVNGCVDEPARGFAVNAMGAHYVAKRAAELGKKLVQLSSDYVFGGDKEHCEPYVETDRPAPLNEYGVSKLAGEHLVRAAHPDNHLIIRTSSLFGCVTSKKGWTFPELMLKKARAGEELKVVVDQVMVPTYTEDLVARILELIEIGAKGTVHVTNTRFCSWYVFACAALEMSGVKAHVTPVSASEFPAKAQRPEYSVLGSERLQELQLPPLRPWEDALRAYLIEKGEIS